MRRFTNKIVTGGTSGIGLASEQVRAMSALPPKADMDQSGCDVRFVPEADIRF